MILGYIRCSSADQCREDRSSLQTQTDIIEGFARTRGADKWGVQIYTDAGVSGATKLAMRPAGDQLLKDMQAGDTVVASKLDRMFRSASDALNMFEEFKARGVHLVLFDMGTESVLESAIAKLIVTILAAVADMERVRIKERTAEGRKAKKARGGSLCRPDRVAFGYRLVGEGRSAVLEPHPVEQQAKQSMIDLYDAGNKCHVISRKLFEAGYKSRTGKPFTPEAVRRVMIREHNLADA
jgi:DNA invertase Pin-like site-specific DNA recombinase